MNRSKIGQKKKKQAVRRLSQSSPAVQANRKEDIRRVLEARRLANSQRQSSDRQKFQGGNPRPGRSLNRNFQSGPFTQSNTDSTQTNMRKHVSPLVNTAVVLTDTKTAHKKASSPLKPTSKTLSNLPDGSAREENVFGSSLFKGRDEQKIVFESTKVGRNLKRKNSSSETQVKQSNVFGAFLSSASRKKDELIFRRTNGKADNVANIHQSPLAMVNKAGISGGSTTSKMHFQSQQTISGDLPLERNQSNLFSGVLTEGSQNTAQIESMPGTKVFKNDSFNSPQIGSTSELFVATNSQPGSQVKAHQSPLSGLATSQNNSQNAMKTRAVVGSGKTNVGVQSGLQSGHVGRLAMKFEHHSDQSSSSNLFAGQSGNVFGSATAALQTPFLSSQGQETGNRTQSSTVAAPVKSLANIPVFGNAICKSVSSTPFQTSQTQSSIFGTAGLSTNTIVFPSNSDITSFGGSAQGSGNIFGSTSLSVTSNSFSNNLEKYGKSFGGPGGQNRNFGNAGLPTSSGKLLESSDNTDNGAPRLPFANGSASNSFKSSSASFGDVSPQTSIFATASLPASSGLLSGTLDKPVSSKSNITAEHSIFGGAALPPKSPSLPKKPAAVFSVQKANSASFPSATQNVPSSGSPKKGSTFGSVTLPISSSSINLAMSSGPFLSNQSPSGTIVSNFSHATTSSGSALSNKGSTFGNFGSSTSAPFSSGNAYGSESAGHLSNAANKSSPSFPFGSTSNKTTAPTQENVWKSQQQFPPANVFGSRTENVLTTEKNKVTSPKSLKQSIHSSGVDLSELTAILLKGLANDYINRDILRHEFENFGEIKKILLQPTKESAVIMFTSHESAKKAKSKAQELFASKNFNVFWYKRKRSTSTSGSTVSKSFGKTSHGTLSKVNKGEFVSRKMSIANALTNIDISTLAVASSAQERFALLDEIDKVIRRAIQPYTDIATAPTIVGVCPDMCPEKERYMREARANLSIFEMVPGTQENRDDGNVPKVDHAKAVKEYSRSAADKHEPLAHEMRPVHVLQMTLDYLAANVMDNGEGRWGEWFNFLWNRTRAIRKDITQQHLCNVESVDLVEKITRFHIFCAHYLCEEDVHSFDPKINNENLTKCLQTLKQFYQDLYSDQNVVCPRESEFQAYDILLNLNEGDTLRKAMQYRIEVRNSPAVKFALEVFSSLNSNNFVRFFKLLKSASYLNACVMHRYFTQVRSRALRMLTWAYRPQEPYPLQGLVDLLAFENKEEAMLFCRHYNLTTAGDSVQFSKSSFSEPEMVFPLQRAKSVIESKRNCSVGEIVCASPLKALPHHQPATSFDPNGRYVGLASLIQRLSGTADHLEPESPDYYHEPAIGVCSEQRSAEITQEARLENDLRLILTQEIQNSCVDLLEKAVNALVKDISEDAVHEAKLKLQMSQALTERFISESLSRLIREVVAQCINEEVRVEREKKAIAESRIRASAVIFGEMLNSVVKSELTAVAREARRDVEQKLKAESFFRMSAVIMREIVEETVTGECRDIALKSRKELLKEKKDALWVNAKTLFRKQQRRFFNRWFKEYRTRAHIRDILLHMPAIPPMLTTQQQLQKLFNEKDVPDSSEKKQSHSPSSSFSLLTERTELKNKLERMAKRQEIKRTRARHPIDVPNVVSEVVARMEHAPPKGSKENRLLKLVISFPDSTQGVEDSFGNVQDLIKCKFCKEAVAGSGRIPVSLRNKIETLSSYTFKLPACTFGVDVKSCSGVLSNEETQLVQGAQLFRGSTGLVFLLDSFGHPRDEMFWSSSRTRLRRILRSKPPVPKIPVAIINITNEGHDDQEFIEHKLNLGDLGQEGLISQSIVHQQEGPLDSDDLHNQLVGVVQWFTCHCPSMSSLKEEKLKSLVENEVLQHFTIPLHEEIAVRRKASLTPQCPEVIIDLYNAVIDHVIAVVTNVTLTEISWPAPEFITVSEDYSPVAWNSSEHLDRLSVILGKLRLPCAPLPAQDGKWKSECALCLDYVNSLLDQQPLKDFGFSLVSSVERILSPFTVDRRSPPTTSLTAADVPWPQVIETCVGTLLSWLHSLPDPAAEKVYYLEEDSANFSQPDLWRVAVTESLRMAKEADLVRRKSKSFDGLRNLGPEIEHELQKMKSRSSGIHAVQSNASSDEIKQSARVLDEKLQTEKESCKRFEERLKSLLHESNDVSVTEAGQSLKRKWSPTWASNSKPEKTFVQKVSSEIEGAALPDLSTTLNRFETTLVTFQNQLELQRHIEELSERQLQAVLEWSP